MVPLNHCSQQTSESKPTKHKESVSAVESNDPSASTVASSIFESVVFSGNIVKSIHTGEEDDVAAPSELTSGPDRCSTQGEFSLCIFVHYTMDGMNVYKLLQERARIKNGLLNFMYFYEQ
jgi:hypothetical protein